MKMFIKTLVGAWLGASCSNRRAAAKCKWQNVNKHEKCSNIAVQDFSWHLRGKSDFGITVEAHEFPLNIL
jgi:hypothetical protein